MKNKAMISPFVVLGSDVVWENEDCVVCRVRNKRKGFDGKPYGREFVVYEVCVKDSYGIGDCVECFDTMSQAIDYVVVNYVEV